MIALCVIVRAPKPCGHSSISLRRKDLHQHCAKKKVMPVGNSMRDLDVFVWAVSHSSQWIILLLFAALFHDCHGWLQFGVGKKHVSYKRNQLISLVSHCTLNTLYKHWNIPVFKSINPSLMFGFIMFPLPFVTCTNNNCALFYYLLNYVSFMFEMSKTAGPPVILLDHSYFRRLCWTWVLVHCRERCSWPVCIWTVPLVTMEGNLTCRSAS